MEITQLKMIFSFSRKITQMNFVKKLKVENCKEISTTMKQKEETKQIRDPKR